jgi:hypothetical protein
VSKPENNGNLYDVIRIGNQADGFMMWAENLTFAKERLDPFNDSDILI